MWSLWVARSRIVLGRVPVRDDYCLEFSMANDDCAGPRSAANPFPALTFPNTRADVSSHKVPIKE